jgi:hypothetical protein
MINIRITGTTPNGEGLVLDSNGHNRAEGRDEIQWEITTPAVRISAIRWKEISGSTNVFPPGYPRSRGGQGRVWHGTVNPVDKEYVYVYTIIWVNDEGVTKEFDPIISIRPSTTLMNDLIGPVAGFVVGGVASLLYWRKERVALKREIERLKLNRQ